MLDKKTIRQHFERVANDYDATAVLQQEVARRLMARLDYIKLTPKRALDVGTGTGFLTKDLLKRYPKAQIIALDIAVNMLKKCQKQGGWVRKPKMVCGDAQQLPFGADSMDLLVSNLMLQWSDNLADTFTGFHSVLAPNGLLLFTTFGPDTLKEFRQSWLEAGNTTQHSDFTDMHEIGDALLQAGFINPVTDMEMITMTYANVPQLLQDIETIGVGGTEVASLIDHPEFKSFEAAYEQFKTADGLYPASWEVIYGHAWVGEGIKYDNFEKIISIKEIK